MYRTVKCSNIGSDGCLRNSTIVDFLQDCSIFHLDTHPVLAPFFEEQNCGMFLVSRQTDIIRKPKYGERVHLKTWTYDCRRMYGFRNTIIFDENEKPCAISYSTGAFMNLETARPMQIPKETLAKIKLNPAFEMEYTPRKIALPDTEPTIFEQVKIKKYQLDMNNHTNNARYIDIADEYLPDDKKVGRIRCEYKKPAKYNDVITPKVYSYSNNLSVDLQGDDGKSFCIIEYTLN